jgi:predicted phage-related endonuclease
MITITEIVSNEQWHALRRPVIGASEAGALLGVHEYKTYFGLWATKSGKLPSDDADNAAMERGRRLEPVAIDVIRDRNPDLELRIPHAHYADHDCGIGATPDLLARHKERGDGVIQIKSVAPSIFRHVWCGETDMVQPPIWIVIQALVERYLTGSAWAAVAPIVVDHDIRLELIEVPDHPAIIETVKDEAKKFWELVASGREPDPDYKRDGELIRKMLQKEDGSEIDLSGKNELSSLLDQRDYVRANAKRYEDEGKAIDAQLFHWLGNAAIGRFPGGYISAKTVSRAAHEVKATSYRQLRVVRKEMS